MIIPIRCYSCGKVVADKLREYQRRTKNGEEPPAVCAEAMERLGLSRYCCKRMFLGHVELVQKL